MMHQVVNCYAQATPTPTPTSSVIIAVQDFDAGTATTDLDVTTSALGGLTPKAAIVVLTEHQSANDPGETAGLRFSVGAIDGSSQWSANTGSQDNVSNTVVTRRGTTTYVAEHSTYNIYTIIEKQLSGTLIPNGIRFARSQSNEDARGFVIFFAGSDVQAKVGSVASMGTTAATTSVTGVGFTPDLVVVAGNNDAMPGGGAFLGMLLGMATANGDQKCISWAETDNAGAGIPTQTIRSAKAICQINTSPGAIAYSGVINNFNSDGFDIVTDASSGGDGIGYLALNFGGAGVSLFDFDTPTSTGSQSYTTPGFQPQFALAVTTNLQSRDASGSTTDLMSGLSICAMADEQWSASMRTDSGADPTDTASNMQNNALMGASATSTAAIVASLTSFGASGPTLNYSAVQGTAKKGFMLCVEDV